MTRTFLDSGVLLTAWKGKDRALALKVMEDPEREFVTGQMVKLELIPEATHQKQTAEVELYETHFGMAVSEEPLSQELGREALALAKKHGLAAADAINVAAAIRQRAQEFITSELPGKPIFRVAEIKVRALQTLQVQACDRCATKPTPNPGIQFNPEWTGHLRALQNTAP